MSDPRLILRQGETTALRLEGEVRAQRFEATRPLVVTAPVAPLRREPDVDSEQLSQLLFGESLEGLSELEGYVFGQSARDGYVGYVDRELLGASVGAPTHRVAALRAYGFSAPSIKSPATGLYSLNSLMTITGTEGRFRQAAGGEWFVDIHLRPIGTFESDPAAVAERFLGAPYFWGGNESLGLDCSGLVQQAFRACGLSCPRDSDQQQALGRALPDRAGLQRNDLVFWKGHVALMLDPSRIIHANAHHMEVAIEPLDEAVRRIAAAGGGAPTAFRRP